MSCRGPTVQYSTVRSAQLGSDTLLLAHLLVCVALGGAIKPLTATVAINWCQVEWRYLECGTFLLLLLLRRSDQGDIDLNGFIAFHEFTTTAIASEFIPRFLRFVELVCRRAHHVKHVVVGGTVCLLYGGHRHSVANVRLRSKDRLIWYWWRDQTTIGTHTIMLLDLWRGPRVAIVFAGGAGDVLLQVRSLEQGLKLGEVVRDA